MVANLYSPKSLYIEQFFWENFIYTELFVVVIIQCILWVFQHSYSLAVQITQALKKIIINSPLMLKNYRLFNDEYFFDFFWLYISFCWLTRKRHQNCTEYFIHQNSTLHVPVHNQLSTMSIYQKCNEFSMSNNKTISTQHTTKRRRIFRSNLSFFDIFLMEYYQHDFSSWKYVYESILYVHFMEYMCGYVQYYINNKKKMNERFFSRWTRCLLYTIWWKYGSAIVMTFAQRGLTATEPHEYCSAPPLSCNRMNRGNIEYFARYWKTRLLVLYVFCFVFVSLCFVYSRKLFFLYFLLSLLFCCYTEHTEKGNALNYCCVYTYKGIYYNFFLFPNNRKNVCERIHFPMREVYSYKRSGT